MKTKTLQVHLTFPVPKECNGSIKKRKFGEILVKNRTETKWPTIVLTVDFVIGP